MSMSHPIPSSPIPSSPTPLSEIKIQRAFRAIAGCFFVLGLIVPTLFTQFPTIRENLEIEEQQIIFLSS